MRLLISVLAAILFAGCGGMYVAKDYAMTPTEMVSEKNPVEFEKAGATDVTSLTCFMNTDLWVEVTVSREKTVPVGAWRLVGMDMDNGKEIKDTVSMAGFTYWGDFLLQGNLPYNKEQMKNVNFFIINGDTGWAYKLTAEPIADFDPKQFVDDPAYKREIYAKSGMNFSRLDTFVEQYFAFHEVSVPDKFSFAREYKVGSPEWQAYKAAQIKKGQSNPKLSGGEIRLTRLTLEEFKKVSIEDPGFSGSGRMLKRGLNVPLFLIPFASQAFAASIASSIGSAAVGAGIDTSYSGPYARATALKRALAPTFMAISMAYKELLAGRDQEIQSLTKEIQKQKYNNYQGKR